VKATARRAGAAAVGLAIALITAAPARSASRVAMAVDVTSSEITLRDSEEGACAWSVANDVVLVNLTDEPVAVTAVTEMVSWTAPEGASGVVNDVEVLEDGGLESGAVLAPREQRSFAPYVVDFNIPCAADTGDLAIRVSNPNGSGSGDAVFLANGSPVPPAALGVVGLAGLIAVGALTLSRRPSTRLRR
jgi:hypothetical protein